MYKPVNATIGGPSKAPDPPAPPEVDEADTVCLSPGVLHAGAVKTISFALGVIQHPTETNKFVLVHERRDRGWWLPGGGLDPVRSHSAPLAELTLIYCSGKRSVRA